MRDEDMNVSIPPGMLAPTGKKEGTSEARKPRARAGGQRRGGSARRGKPPASAAAGPVELPTENPYAGDRRVPMNHRVYESFPARLQSLSQQLIDAGYSPRQASQAELLQMILHDSMPANVEDAARRMQLWALVKAAPPGERG